MPANIKYILCNALYMYQIIHMYTEHCISRIYVCIALQYIHMVLVNKDIHSPWGLECGSNFWGTTIQLTMYRGESWIGKESYHAALSVKHFGLLC